MTEIVRKYQRLAKMWGIVLRPHWNCHLFQVGVKIGTNALKNYITLSDKVKANYPMIPRDVSNRN